MSSVRSVSAQGGSSQQPPLMPPVPAGQQQYMVDETGAVYTDDPNMAGLEVAASYYKQDGTFVQVMSDGTEYHYPPAENGDEGMMMDVGQFTDLQNAGGAAAGGAAVGGARENPLEEHRFYPPRGVQDANATNGSSATNTGSSAAVPSGAAASTTGGAAAAAPAATVVPIPADQAAAAANGEVTEREVAMPKKGTASGISLHDDIPSGPWIGNLATEIFVSTAFKFYFAGLMYSCFVIEFFIGFDYMWACLFRMFAPPDSRRAPFWQSLTFMAIFLVFSFVVTAMLGAIIDATREFWQATKTDTMLWGLNSRNAPPWIIHGVVVLATTVAPVMWSFIQCVSEQHTAVWFVQHIFFSTLVIPLCLTIALYGWYFCLSLWQKSRAHQLSRLHEDDGDDGGEEAQEIVNAQGRPITAKSWYHHDSILREYGLDAKTLLWMIPVFIIGLAPLFVLAILIATEGTTVTWNIEWTVVAVAFLVMLAVLRELTNSKHKSNAAIGCLILVILFIILGLIGAGSSGNPNLFGVLLLTSILCQFFLLRKRPYRLGKKEIEEKFGPAVDEVPDPFDSYLCFCRNSLFTCLGACFDMRGIFGMTHPDVRKLEKARRATRMSLWSDQKFIMYYWGAFWVTLIFVLSYSRSSATTITAAIATRTNVPMYPAITNYLGQDPTRYEGNSTLNLCTARYNPFSASSVNTLSLYDLSLLSSLGYSYGDQWRSDFRTWFSHTTLLPLGKVPLTSSEAVGETGWAQWIDFYDNTSNFHFLGVRGIDRGVGWMRNVDVWGDSLTLQAAQVLAPGISFWPIGQKRDFVDGISFFKKVCGGMNVTEGLEKYAANLTAFGHRVMLFGHGSNGGLARLVGAKLNLPSISFAGPGVSILAKKYQLNPDAVMSSLNVKSTNDVVSLVDDNTKDGAQIMVPCRTDIITEHKCDGVVGLTRAIGALCGDPHGRSILDLPEVFT